VLKNELRQSIIAFFINALDNSCTSSYSSSYTFYNISLRSNHIDLQRMEKREDPLYMRLYQYYRIARLLFRLNLNTNNSVKS